jgi:hypothetical protein
VVEAQAAPISEKTVADEGALAIQEGCAASGKDESKESNDFQDNSIHTSRNIDRIGKELSVLR